ncbi:hypothetical protein LZ30DRAFT_719883 [Colletotrichum cereale]|nr:hypothetical protein LZ30DRAFT_719883 [Colletotrichum cereale]
MNQCTKIIPSLEMALLMIIFVIILVASHSHGDTAVFASRVHGAPLGWPPQVPRLSPPKYARNVSFVTEDIRR